MADMQELIARLEAADAGSRELDVAIRDALIPDGAANDFNFLTGFADRPETHGVMRVRIVEDYTTSLDAALALAERSGLQGSDIMHKAWSMMAKKHALHCRPYTGESYARDAALQACIAILKAKAQGEGG